MARSTRRGPPWSTLALVFSGILWFYLLLYFCGVLDVRRYGGVYALALFAATLIATFTSPYRASPRWQDEAMLERPPQRPRLRTYAAMAGVVFVAIWLVARAMEWISLSLTDAVRWPVSGLPGVLVVAAVALVGTGLFALTHLLVYRKHVRSRSRG